MIERFVTLIAARVMALCTGISALKFGGGLGGRRRSIKSIGQIWL